MGRDLGPITPSSSTAGPIARPRHSPGPCCGAHAPVVRVDEPAALRKFGRCHSASPPCALGPICACAGAFKFPIAAPNAINATGSARPLSVLLIPNSSPSYLRHPEIRYAKSTMFEGRLKSAATQVAAPHFFGALSLKLAYTNFQVTHERMENNFRAHYSTNTDFSILYFSVTA